MLGTYIWWTVKFSSVENELKRLFYRIKDKLTKIKIKPLHKLFSFIIFLKLLLKLICMTLLHIVTALLTSRFFISNQKSLVFICIKVSKESNNVIEIELETIFVKSNLISPKYFFARHIYGVVLERTFSFFVVAIPFTISLFDENLSFLSKLLQSHVFLTFPGFHNSCLHERKYSTMPDFHPTTIFDY